ncbi:hypothetical protein BST21_11275 [Mycolicibacterium celeriflavum]|nr:hypothetical protein BST21_11275 [Mycolicibacterium celeriflavum]
MCRFFRRITADAVNPQSAAMMATASSRAVESGGPNEPIGNLPGVVSSSRCPDQITFIASQA